jgi:hypothetical protein
MRLRKTSIALGSAVAVLAAASLADTASAQRFRGAANTSGTSMVLVPSIAPPSRT